MEKQETRADLYKLQTQRNDLKQHADKIIQGIKKIGPNHAKRAIWELFQNAVDLSPYCEITIAVTELELIFSHNGVPFTMQTLDCLFTQVSSKTLTEKKLDREEADPIGQYGTGFMTSHSFGDIVKVSGGIQDHFEDGDNKIQTEGHIHFDGLEIDRSTEDWEKLCDEIRELRSKVTKLLSLPLTYDELPYTVFKFKFNNELNKKRAIDAIQSLRTILPYVMIFNDRLKKVNVTDITGNTTEYRKNDIELNKESYFSQSISINNEVKQINYLKSDRLIIALPFKDLPGDGDFIGISDSLPPTLPRLFLFYPLIGSEHFGFNFVIHSKNFQPTEPRDGLHLKSENEKNRVEEEANQKLLEEASTVIFNFLENIIKKIKEPHLFADIHFPLNSDNQELNKYFIILKEKWTTKFKTLPLVETLTGNIPVQNAVFLNSTVIYGTDPITLEAIYTIVGKFYTNLPKPCLIPIWTKLTDEWNVGGLTRIGFEDIAEKISEAEVIGSFNKVDLILLYKEIIRKEKEGLFTTKALLPNIKGQFRIHIELSRTVDLTEKLLAIADILNSKISNRQIDPDFLLEGLKFESFGRKNYMEQINASLDTYIKDGTRSHNLPENYLASLIQYASIVPKADSASGPVRVIKLIAEHYHMPFSTIVLPTVQGEDNLDVRKGQFDFFKIYLNDISDKDKDWVEPNINSLSKVLAEAFGYADVKKMFLRYDVYPNQLFKLKSINSLHKENKIPLFVKDLFDEVVNLNEPIRSKLAHASVENILEEMKLTSSLDLTRQIEQRFFGDSGSEIHMESNPYKSHIIKIIRNFKQDQPLWETHEKLFPATSRNKSAILVQLADGEASFTILSQDEDVIKKLAGIACNPNLDELIKFGEDALREKQQYEAEMQFKKQIGNHLEDVLRQHLAENMSAKTLSVQNGQDLVIYIEDQPVYYIEVKSKWLETTPIRISRNQTLQAHQNPDCFALCSIDMTNYTGIDKYKVESINSIIEHMKFNTDVGTRVDHLVTLYANAHQEDEFSIDGDYRTHIPSGYIKEGKDLIDFETILLGYINNRYDKLT